MMLSKRKTEEKVAIQPMRVRIKRRVGAGGPAELKISGCANTWDMEGLRKAIDHFEKNSYMKCYLNLGNTKHLCPDAINEIHGLSRRIEERGDMFDIVALSTEAELEIRDMGLQNTIRPLYPWPYSVSLA